MHTTMRNKTISEVKVSVKFYSLYTSFRVNAWVVARVEVRTQTNKRMDDAKGATKSCHIEQIRDSNNNSGIIFLTSP